jgi:hypothetical protein
MFWWCVIGPVDVYYVLPIAAVALAKNLRFYPDIECKCARWEGYREAWRVMGVEWKLRLPDGTVLQCGLESTVPRHEFRVQVHSSCRDNSVRHVGDSNAGNSLDSASHPGIQWRNHQASR